MKAMLIAAVIWVMMAPGAPNACQPTGPVMDEGPTGAGITVAVIDSGLNPDYIGAPGKVAEGRYFYYREEANGAYTIYDSGVTKRCGYYSSGDTTDDVGHGTMMSSVIADIAPDVTIMPMRWTSDANGGIGAESSVASCIKYAAENGADIINMSLALGGDDGAVRAAIKSAADAGCILIASAGNSGVSTRQYPAAYPQVISVGAVDKNGSLALFSQRGEWVDLYAWGKGVHFVGEPNGHTGRSGTSISAAMVSGVAALALEACPDMTQAEFLALLKESCVPIEGQDGGALDMEKLLRAIKELRS